MTAALLDINSADVPADNRRVKLIALRRDDTCCQCGTSLATGTRAGWDSMAKTVTCATCLNRSNPAAPTPEPLRGESTPPPIARGTAGGSVTREAARRSERHKQRQEERVAADQAWRTRAKEQHPILGRVASAVTPKVQPQAAPQHVAAWTIGAHGEIAVGEALEKIPGIIVLHDRHKPRSRANIDHVAVTPAGVWVIDTKVRDGKKLEYRDKGGWLRTDERLIVGGRDQTKLVQDMAWQVQTVFEVCGDLLGDTVIRPALCFVDATIGWLTRRPWMVRGVVICWRTLLPDLLTRPGPFDETAIDQIARRVAERLPSG